MRAGFGAGSGGDVGRLEIDGRAVDRRGQDAGGTVSGVAWVDREWAVMIHSIKSQTSEAAYSYMCAKLHTGKASDLQSCARCRPSPTNFAGSCFRLKPNYKP